MSGKRNKDLRGRRVKTPHMKKLIVKVVILVVLLVAGYLTYTYFFYTCCAPKPKEKIRPSPKIEDSKLNDPDLLLAWRTWSGLCTNNEGEGGSCWNYTYLYSSGDLNNESGWSDGEKSLTYSAVQRKLDKNIMSQVIKQIRDSGILNKECPVEPVTDYNTTYLINLDNTTREIEFPGCESELNEIDRIIKASE